MNTEIQTSGPFGNYPLGSAGSILNSLCNEGVPLNVVEHLTIAGDGTLKDGDKEFARYKFIRGIDKPLFYFQNQTYARQTAIWHDVDGKKVLKPKFRLSLYHHGSASLVISKHIDGELFTEDLWYFIKSMIYASLAFLPKEPTVWQKTEHQLYNLRQNSGAFFQGGSDSPRSQFIYIEFWKPEGAQAFVDYVNNNFIYKDAVYVPPPDDY